MSQSLQQSHIGDSQRQRAKNRGFQKEAEKMSHYTWSLDTETYRSCGLPALWVSESGGLYYTPDVRRPLKTTIDSFLKYQNPEVHKYQQSNSMIYHKYDLKIKL